MMDRLALPRDIGVWQWKRTGLFGLDLGLRTWTPAPRHAHATATNATKQTKHVYCGRLDITVVPEWGAGLRIHQPERPETKYERV